MRLQHNGNEEMVQASVVIDDDELEMAQLDEQWFSGLYADDDFVDN